MTPGNQFNSQASKTTQETTTGRHLMATKHLPAVCAGMVVVGLLLGLGSCSKHGKTPAVTASNESTSPAPIVRETSTSEPTTGAATGPKRIRKPRRTNATYVNQSYGVSFSYPKKYGLKIGDQALLTWQGAQPVPTGFPKSAGVTVAAVVLPAELYPDTDLRSAFLSLNVNRNLTASACEQFAASERKTSEATKPFQVKLGSIEFSEMEDLDGGDQRQADTKYYHVFRNEICYEFALRVGTAQDGEDKSTPQVDRTQVFRSLEKILASVQIKPVAAASAKAPVDSQNNQPTISAPASVISSDKL
jgi:hypothetical protein